VIKSVCSSPKWITVLATGFYKKGAHHSSAQIFFIPNVCWVFENRRIKLKPLVSRLKFHKCKWKNVN